MRVCLTCHELFGAGKIGGFGRATRAIGRELVRRNIEVAVVVPRTRDDLDEAEAFTIDGMRVFRFDPKSYRSTVEAYRSCDADIYHTQDASMMTYLAMKAMPDRAHVVTCRDPMTLGDLMVEFRYARRKLGALKYSLYANNYLVSRAVRRAANVNCPAKFLGAKTRKIFRLRRDASFLPTPHEIPKGRPRKADRPTVCFVGRWDPRKKPELFFELARAFPDVRFIAVGGSLDKARDECLRRAYGDIPNLELPGLIDQFTSNRLWDILEKSWVIVNPAAREGLPNTFIEAAARRCAILSFCDPDGFASSFGYHAEDGDLVKGLSFLLEDDNWRRLGQAGYDYVRAEYAADKAIDAHLDLYRKTLQQQT